MDLSYFRFEADLSAAVLPPDLAVLLIGVAAGQAASPTAMLQSRLAAPAVPDLPFRPTLGAFDARQAERLGRWAAEVNPVFT